MKSDFAPTEHLQAARPPERLQELIAPERKAVQADRHALDRASRRVEERRRALEKRTKKLEDSESELRRRRECEDSREGSVHLRAPRRRRVARRRF